MIWIFGVLDFEHSAQAQFGALTFAPSFAATRGHRLQLAYPLARWLMSPVPFSEFGLYTDGPGTPWAEWFDSILRALCVLFRQRVFFRQCAVHQPVSGMT
jgi:hypothetical protein